MSGAVHLLAPDEAAALRRRLDEAGFAFRRVPHASFSARGEDVVVTYYPKRRKLLVQGKGADAFAARFLGGRTAAPPPTDADAGRAAAVALPALGSDEAGKGDTFGPLVVCAAAVDESVAAELTEAGVVDSKRLADRRVHQLAAWFAPKVPHEVRVLDPAEYAARREAAGGNVNHLLCELHADALRALHRRTGIARAVVDRFASGSPVSRALRGDGLEVTEVPRAEAHPAVAAASVLARSRFLDALQRLSEEAAVELPKGSGAPTRRALRDLLALHGPDGLGRFAKTHFTNVRRALDEHGS